MFDGSSPTDGPRKPRLTRKETRKLVRSINEVDLTFKIFVEDLEAGAYGPVGAGATRPQSQPRPVAEIEAHAGEDGSVHYTLAYHYSLRLPPKLAALLLILARDTGSSDDDKVGWKPDKEILAEMQALPGSKIMNKHALRQDVFRLREALQAAGLPRTLLQWNRSKQSYRFAVLRKLPPADARKTVPAAPGAPQMGAENPGGASDAETCDCGRTIHSNPANTRADQRWTAFARALAFAAYAHRAHSRKMNTNIPYIYHPIGAAGILLESGCREELAIAAVLHDTVEDTDTTLDEIEREFGPGIARLVDYMTEPDKSLPWADRKMRKLERLGQAQDDVLLISCADHLDNLISLQDDIKRHGEQVWDKLNADRNAQALYFRRLALLFKDRLQQEPGATLALEFEKKAAELFGVF